MLTLQELKKITDMPGDREKLPTAKQLRITGLVVAQKQLGQEAEISAYRNGSALYRVGKRSTVFFLHPCRDYLYISDGSAVCLPEQFFEHERWYLRLVLEGEDRLNRNNEERERSRNISYSAISEDWDVMGDWPESVIEQMVKRETVIEILYDLTERQKCIIQKYYLQEETQEQISEELGISQQTVSATISQTICSIRKKYSTFQKLSDNRIFCEESKV